MAIRFAIVALAALAALHACRDIDVVTASYATLAEARKAGAIERGWIPAGLPDGSHGLREAHDLDSNRRWGLFSFSAADRDDLQALLRPEETSLDGVTCDIPGRIEWWPVILRGDLDEARIRATGLKAHRAARGDLIFVVQWSQGRAYYFQEAGGRRKPEG